MSLTVYPAKAADNPQSRHCETCGLIAPGFWLDGDASSTYPCPDRAECASDCEAVAGVYTSSYGLALALERGDVSPELRQWLASAGVSDATLAEWVKVQTKRGEYDAEIAGLFYSDEPNWLRDMMDWIAAGGDQGDRLVAVLKRVYIEPPYVERTMTFPQISRWHDQLARRVHELVAEVGEYEGDADG